MAKREIMKRVILSLFIIGGITLTASAQSSGSSGSATGSGTSTSAPKSAKTKKPSEKLNNRKIYHFNNGQRSTPTGAEATPSSTGGGFAAIGTDTTPKANAATPKSAATKKSGTKRKQ
jgi:hypothetical protein